MKINQAKKGLCKGGDVRGILLFITLLFSLSLCACSTSHSLHKDTLHLKARTSLQRMPFVKLPAAFTAGLHPSAWKKKRNATLVHLWASWCAPCLSELQELKMIWQKHGKDLDVLLIAVASEKNTVQDILKRYKLPFDSLLDKNAILPAKLASPAMPLSLFVDRYGEILLVPDPQAPSRLLSRIEGAQSWLSKNAQATIQAVIDFEAKQPE